MSQRKKNVIQGFFASIGSSFVLQLVSFAVIPIYLGYTSQDLYGLWLTLGAILGWIKIGDLGLGLSLTRRAIEALENSNYEQMNRLLNGALLISISFGIIISSIIFSFFDLIVTTFAKDPAYQQDFGSVLKLLLIVAIVKPPFNMFSSIINAKQKLAFLNIKNSFLSILAILISILFLSNGFGILSFGIGLLFEAITILLVDMFYLRLIDKNLIFFKFKTSKADILSLLDFGIRYQILKVANLVATNTDNLIIASILGAASVSIYVFTGKLGFLLGVFLVSMIPSILFPGISQLFDQGNEKKLRALYEKLLSLSLRLGIFFAACYYCINGLFVNLWVGNENYGGDNLTLLFCFWIISESFVRGLTSIIYASSDIKGLTLLSVFEAALNIIITLSLIDEMGLNGVVLGTILSRVVTIIYIPFKINSLLFVPIKEFSKSIFFNIMINALPLIACIVIFSNYFISLDILAAIKIPLIGLMLMIVNILFIEGLVFINNSHLTFRERLLKIKNDFGNI